MINGRPPSNIQLVLLDLDDTLHDDTLAFRCAASDVSVATSQGRVIDPQRLTEAFVEELEDFWQHFDAQSLAPGTNVRKLMWARALERFGIDDQTVAEQCAVSFEERRKTYYNLFPGAVEALTELQRMNFRLALLTNGLTTTHREKIRLLGLSNYFSAIFLSDEIGVSKPDPQAFLFACKELGAAPSETVMVGDRYDKDVLGALNAGMSAVWLNIRNENIPSGSPKPDAIVSDISEVPAALQALRKTTH